MNEEQKNDFEEIDKKIRDLGINFVGEIKEPIIFMFALIKNLSSHIGTYKILCKDKPNDLPKVKELLQHIIKEIDE